MWVFLSVRRFNLIELASFYYYYEPLFMIWIRFDSMADRIEDRSAAVATSGTLETSIFLLVYFKESLILLIRLTTCKSD